jgi:hypothetical protein
MAPASGEAPASAEAAASEAAEAPASAEAAEAPASGEAPASVASAEAPASAEALPRDVQQWQDDLFKELFDAPSGQETVAAADAEADREEQLLKQGAEKGFGLREALGWRFTREQGENTSYKAMARKDKADFRQRWAEAKYDEHCKSKVYEESFTQNEFAKGTRRSLGWVLANEGGANNPEAVRSTLFFANKCKTLGAPYVTWNSMYDRPDFLVMEVGHEENFEKAWRQKTESRTMTRASTSDRPLQPQDEPGTPVHKKAKLEDDAPAEVAISTQKAGGRKTPRAQSKATPPVDDKKRGGGGGGGGASTASQANKTKQVFANTSVATQQICRNVESNDDWAWATTCVIFLDMKKHMDEVNTLVKGSSFALQDLKKRGYDMDKEYAKVPATLSQTACKVSKLLKMHRSAMDES